MSTEQNPKAVASIAELRSSAAARKGKLWRSLEELADSAEYRAFLHNEFPHDPANEPKRPDRRDVLKWMAASAAFAGLTGCTKMPEQKIVPYVQAPEEIIPGKPLFYASSLTQGGIASGVLVESHMGRPTKVEGNPSHPASLGATDIFSQAAILDLYDPDRSQTMIREGRISSWGTFVAVTTDIRTNFTAKKGEGLRILTGMVTSPTLAAQIQDVLKQFPQARWHQWEACGRDNAREGAKLAFGRYTNAVYRFDKADIILSLDADFLYSGPGAVRHARDFAARRDPNGSRGMNRLYAVEQAATTTGAMADHRLALRACDIEGFARALASALHIPQVGGAASQARIPAGWIDALARDLQNHRGACVVVAGENQPPAVHALAHAVNAALGAAGNTVVYTDPVEARPENELESLKALASDMAAGRVDTIYMFGVNPVYDAPRDLNFAQNLLKVNFRVHNGLYEDETAELCHWHVPAAHELESWSDARAFDGTASVVQPLISPLYEGKTAHEVMAALQGKGDQPGHDLVRSYWQTQFPGKNPKDFEAFWETSLHDGVIANTTFEARSLTPVTNLGVASSGAAAQQDAIEIVFRPDPSIGDGRYANNAWLQELPKPITRLTWENSAQMSPDTAQHLGLKNGDYIRIDLNANYVQAPVWIVPGQAANSVTLHLGYGRVRAGRIGSRIGFDANQVRTTAAPLVAYGAQFKKVGDGYELAATQHHRAIEQGGNSTELESDAAAERELIQIGTLDEFRRNPKFAQEAFEPPRDLTLYQNYAYTGYAWGLAIDLNKCVGCNACVVACQSENNIAVVGKDEVLRGREMHWIRVDTYFRGELEQPETYFEPVPCMHCENAPCEGVCPVAATTHSPEGLNEMVYNRCVGTRYCSNNCPYKVRHFNFGLFSDYNTVSLYAMRNPNVTVRSRGVMEKCSYCVQRIQAAKIDAEEQNRYVRDGEIKTACQQVCPADAIVFGDINQSANRVSKWKADPRNFHLLAELNTRPRTSYLARLRNPNPEMPKQSS